MIICGFPGVGKSAKARVSWWVDLESTPFNKDWDTYARVAKYMSDQGYFVMVSTHSELRYEFELRKVDYSVVIPPLSDKEIYRQRFIKRRDTDQFIDYVMEHWDEWLTDIIDQKSKFKQVVILPSNGFITTATYIATSM